MRFLNTRSIDLIEIDEHVLQGLGNSYCVLSHRWEEGEVLYTDFQAARTSNVNAKHGYDKLIGACETAKALGFDLLWIDTCCINKSDAVETGEAINSMYRWYSRAQVCIAYLSDIHSQYQICGSDWFSRGWTLQELIAPKTVRFYSKDWYYLGDKSSLSLPISVATSIPAEVLNNEKPPQAYSVAQRMSWAAKRITTRIEDRAYSLMGLFDVNLPVIYGEQAKAFIRLQEEIISKSADETIFIWDLDLLDGSSRDPTPVYCGLLAPSPACFARCSKVVSFGRSRGFTISQFGLSISLPAAVYNLGTYQAILNVTRTDCHGQCALLLAKLPNGGSYARTSSVSGKSVLMVDRHDTKPVSFRVPLQPLEIPLDQYPGFWLRKLNFQHRHIYDFRILRRVLSSATDRLKLPDGEIGTAGIIRLTLPNRSRKTTSFGWIKFGFDFAFQPVCLLAFPSSAAAADTFGHLSSRQAECFPDRAELASRMHHDPIFDSAWTYATSQTISELPSYCYDSRQCRRKTEAGFSFVFRAPLFRISVNATNVLDTNPLSSGETHVWAIDIKVYESEVKTPKPDRSQSHCCCS